MNLPIIAEQVIRREWFPPSRDCYKINVDAAYCSTSRVSNLRAVVRNMRAEVSFSAVTKAKGIVTTTSKNQGNILWFTCG